MRSRAILRLLQILFGVMLFIAPLVFFWALVEEIRAQSGNLVAPPPGASSLTGLISLLAVLASVFSLIGIISTTILAWRKDRRDVNSFQLELEKKELEITKLRRELDESYSQSPKAHAQAQKLGREEASPQDVVGQNVIVGEVVVRQTAALPK
jgi:hypothetical protein